MVLRISGYGQTGPYRDRPGFGVVGEAMGGLRHLTAEPGRVPVRVGVSIGDTLAALHGVIGILMALHERQRSGQGQVIDVALYEAVFNCMESLLPEYSAFGAVRGPAGSALPGIAPSNAYLCSDGGYALVAGNGDSIFKRLMATIGRDDLGSDPALADNAGRVKRSRRSMPPSANGRTRSVDEVLQVLDAPRAGRPHLHRGRHRRRPALRRPRHAAADPLDDGDRSPCRASCPALAHPGRPAQRARHRPGHRRVMRELGLTPEQIAALKSAASSRHRMKQRIFFNEVVTRDGFQIEPEFIHRRQGGWWTRSAHAATPRSRSPPSPRPRPSPCCATPRR